MSPASAARALCLVLLLSPCQGRALTFDFPGPAEQTRGRTATLGSAIMPTGPWAEGSLPARRVEGAVVQSAWHIDAPGLTTLHLLAPLRDQLQAAGFAVLWECDTANCGGFDFRFALDVLPEPDMHVDLGDFRFLVAERAGVGGPETVSLLVSRSAQAGFVQVTQVGGAGLALATPAPGDPVAAPAGAPGTDIARALDLTGAMALDDLTFPTGSARLGPGDFASLRAIADYLAEHPDRKVTLVGHTDMSGDLAGNVVLSRSRAASVRERLIAEHGAPAGRIAAEGVGYLAPRATNLTAEGRTLNRRVEVVLTSIR